MQARQIHIITTNFALYLCQFALQDSILCKTDTIWRSPRNKKLTPKGIETRSVLNGTNKELFYSSLETSLSHEKKQKHF